MTIQPTSPPGDNYSSPPSPELENETDELPNIPAPRLERTRSLTIAELAHPNGSSGDEIPDLSTYEAARAFFDSIGLPNIVIEMHQ